MEFSIGTRHHRQHSSAGCVQRITFEPNASGASADTRMSELLDRVDLIAIPTGHLGAPHLTVLDPLQPLHAPAARNSCTAPRCP